MQTFYHNPPPQINPEDLKGKLLVIEGPDGSGRSTQIEALTEWLEERGHLVINVGIKRSNLISEALSDAQNGNVLTRTTMSLFYATDFADQLENTILPGLRSGAIVLCDRYIYTLMCRDMVRGAKREWVENLYGFACVPQIVVYLNVEPELLVERYFEKNRRLDYWESGMDIRLADNFLDSFMIYQRLLNQAFLDLKDRYDYHVIDGNLTVKEITENIKTLITPIIDSSH